MVEIEIEELEDGTKMKVVGATIGTEVTGELDLVFEVSETR